MGNQYLSALASVFEDLQSVPVGRLYVDYIKKTHDTAVAESSKVGEEIRNTVSAAKQDNNLTPSELHKVRADAMNRFMEAERKFKTTLAQIDHQNQALIQDPTDTEPEHDSTFPIYTTNVAGTKLLQTVAMRLKTIQNCIEDQILPDPTLANTFSIPSTDGTSSTDTPLRTFINHLFVSYHAAMKMVETEEVVNFVKECQDKIVDILERKVKGQDVELQNSEVNEEADDSENLTPSDMLALPFFKPLKTKRFSPSVINSISNDDAASMKLKGTPAKQERIALNPNYTAANKEMSHYRIDTIKKYQLPVFNFLKALQNEPVFTTYKIAKEKQVLRKRLKSSEKDIIHMVSTLLNYIKSLNYFISKIFYVANSYKESLEKFKFLLNQISAVIKSISKRQPSFIDSTKSSFSRLENSLEALNYYIMLSVAEGTLKHSEIGDVEKKKSIALEIDSVCQDISTLIYNKIDMDNFDLLTQIHDNLSSIATSLAFLPDKDSKFALTIVKKLRKEMFNEDTVEVTYTLSVSPPEELAVPPQDSGCVTSPESVSEAPSPIPVSPEHADEPNNSAVVLKHPKPMRAEKHGQTARADTPNRPATPTQHLTATAPA